MIENNLEEPDLLSIFGSRLFSRFYIMGIKILPSPYRICRERIVRKDLFYGLDEREEHKDHNNTIQAAAFTVFFFFLFFLLLCFHKRSVFKRPTMLSSVCKAQYLKSLQATIATPEVHVNDMLSGTKLGNRNIPEIIPYFT